MTPSSRTSHYVESRGPRDGRTERVSVDDVLSSVANLCQQDFQQQGPKIHPAWLLGQYKVVECNAATFCSLVVANGLASLQMILFRPWGRGGNVLW